MNPVKNNVLAPVSEALAHCNGRVKISPNGAVLEVMYTSRPVFNWAGFEPLEKECNQVATERGRNNEQSRKRARKKVFDYAACNPDVFDLFITMTLSKEEIDRYDINKIYPKLKQWLTNRVTRKGLAYILIPELHKDGAIHFHGLINSSAVKLADSGKKIWKRGPNRGKTIYNVTDWKYGFTTACKLTGDYMNVCKYITKYVTKQTEGGLIGGRYYYHGGDLKGPHYEYINFNGQPEGDEYRLEEADLTVVYVTDLTKCQFDSPRVELSRCKGGDLRKQILPGLDCSDDTEPS